MEQLLLETAYLIVKLNENGKRQEGIIKQLQEQVAKLTPKPDEKK